MTIIRNGKEAKGGVTAEELALMKEHSEKWIKIAYRTEPIDKEKITAAIKGLYEASGLKEPRVVVVSSPKIAAYAWALAASVWELRSLNATLNATDYATDYATDNATLNATLNATRYATDNATGSATDNATLNAAGNATDNATGSATFNATLNATLNATRNATDNATLNATLNAARYATDNATLNATLNATNYATLNATRNATDNATLNATDYVCQTELEIVQALAEEFLGEHKGIVNQYLTKSYRHYQGGNMWAAYDCYLTAYRDILKLDLPIYEKYKYWEEAALQGGFRYMHSEFCIVSDFPLYIRINKENQPHCDGAPSHEWRDGWKLWHLNGVAVDQWMAETSADELDVKQIMQIKNVDQRREVLRRLGMERFVTKAEAKIIDALILEDPSFYKNGEVLYELLLADLGEGESVKLLKMDSPSIDAIHVEAVHEDCMTVQESINWRAYGDKALTDKKLQWRPSQLT